MRLWQSAMIALAQSKRVAATMHASRLMQRFSRQFVAGPGAGEAVERARQLQAQGIDSSLFFLGEYVDQPALVERSVREIIDVVSRLAEAGLDVHVSVDPTQIGATIDWSLCQANALRIAEVVARQSTSRRRLLMLDMEDSSVTQGTLDLREELGARGFPVAVTVQSYLRRTEEDVRRLVRGGVTVRLVKGALAEKADVAYTSRADIDASFEALAERLLSAEARVKGVYPVFGTHDERMIAHVLCLASANGWSRDQWEVEMLLGVRPIRQRELVAQGLRLRLYMPFGEAWWPYSIRRIGESPKNLRFVLRALLARG